MIETAYVPFGKFQLRVRRGYIYQTDAEVISLDVAYGLKTIRENMGVLFSIAE